VPTPHVTLHDDHGLHEDHNAEHNNRMKDRRREIVLASCHTAVYDAAKNCLTLTYKENKNSYKLHPCTTARSASTRCFSSDYRYVYAANRLKKIK